MNSEKGIQVEKMRRAKKGLGLVELMVAVVIVGILGVVAVSVYQDYTIRSQVTEGLSLVSGAKTHVVEYYANHGEFPENKNDLGAMSSQGSFVNSISLGENGVILASFSGEANASIVGETIRLIPRENGFGNLVWSCDSSVESRYLPSSCNNSGSESNDVGNNEITPFFTINGDNELSVDRFNLMHVYNTTSPQIRFADSLKEYVATETDIYIYPGLPFEFKLFEGGDTLLFDELSIFGENDELAYSVTATDLDGVRKRINFFSDGSGIEFHNTAGNIDLLEGGQKFVSHMNLPLVNQNHHFLSSNPVLKNKLVTLVAENEIFEKHFKNNTPISIVDLNRYEKASEELKREMMNVYKANNFAFPNNTPASLQSAFSYFHLMPHSEF